MSDNQHLNLQDIENKLSSLHNKLIIELSNSNSLANSENENLIIKINSLIRSICLIKEFQKTGNLNLLNSTNLDNTNKDSTSNKKSEKSNLYKAFMGK